MEFTRVFFIKIACRQAAIDVAKWAGWLFYGIAALFVFWSLFLIPHLDAIAIYLFIAFFYAVCGYLTASKLSRSAVIMGTLMVLPCMALPAPDSASCLWGVALWFGVRGIEATCKLHGRFRACK
jgi:hypothetical protein